MREPYIFERCPQQARHQTRLGYGSKALTIANSRFNYLRPSFPWLRKCARSSRIRFRPRRDWCRYLRPWNPPQIASWLWPGKWNPRSTQGNPLETDLATRRCKQGPRRSNCLREERRRKSQRCCQNMQWRQRHTKLLERWRYGQHNRFEKWRRKHRSCKCWKRKANWRFEATIGKSQLSQMPQRIGNHERRRLHLLRMRYLGSHSWQSKLRSDAHHFYVDIGRSNEFGRESSWTLQSTMRC